jgi:hypothetical protein
MRPICKEHIAVSKISGSGFIEYEHVFFTLQSVESTSYDGF